MFAAKNLLLSGAAPPPVAYDSVGAGWVGQIASGSTGTWSHTIGTGVGSGGALVAFVFAAGAISIPTATVKVGSTAMTSLGSTATVGADGKVYLFGLLNPPTGSQTLTVTIGGTTSFTTANSVSYLNVTGFGTVATNSGSGTSASLSVSSTSGQMAAAAFGASYNAGASLSAYSQTQRYSKAYASGTNPSLVMGDAVAGGSSVNFSATVSTSTTWGAIGVPLVP